MKPLFTLLLVLFLFWNEPAFGKTVRLDQADMKFDIPDDFVQKDMGFPDAIYTAVRYKENRLTEVISIAVEEGVVESQDPNSPIAKSEDVGMMGNVLEWKLRDVLGNRFLYAETQHGNFSEALFEIPDSDHTISITFKKYPLIQGLVADDPMVMMAMDSFGFIHPRPPPTSRFLPTFEKDILLGIVLVILVIRILWRFMGFKRWLSSCGHDDKLFGWLTRRGPD